MSDVGQSTVPFSLYRIYILGLYRLYESCLKRAQVNPIGCHNLLTVLVVVLVHVLTGIRFVDVPLAHLSHWVDSNLEMILPRDKDRDDFWKVRIAYMPPICAEILIAYALHLSLLVRKLNAEKKFELAGQFHALLDEKLKIEEQPIAYFTLIDPFFSPKHLTKQYISQTLGKRFPFRLEEARCQFCGFLRRLGGPDFVKEDQLGHQKEQYPTYAANHQWCISDFKASMQPLAEKYVEKLGLINEKV